jgi:hypothetical protein
MLKEKLVFASLRIHRLSELQSLPMEGHFVVQNPPSDSRLAALLPKLGDNSCDQREAGDEATRRRGDEATRRRGDEATRRRGDEATRRRGDEEDVSHRTVILLRPAAFGYFA